MADIGDQFSEKTVALSIKALKIDAQLLAKAMTALLKGSRNLTAQKNMAGKGKQTVKQLVKQGQGVSNIEINDKNIKSFESVARKYGVDFALKKDKNETPPKWLVFFKAKDADALTSAFKEFTAKEAKKNATKASVLATMKNFNDLVKTQVIDKVKDKIRGAFIR